MRRNPFISNPTITGKQVANDLFLVLIGAILQAAAYSIFIAPAGIVPGGVYGISIGINHLTQGLWSLFPEGLPIGKVSISLYSCWRLVSSAFIPEGKPSLHSYSLPC